MPVHASDPHVPDRLRGIGIFYERNQQQLSRRVRSMARDAERHEEPEDFVQDTFVKLLESPFYLQMDTESPHAEELGSSEIKVVDESELLAWCSTVAKNEALGSIAKKRNRARLVRERWREIYSEVQEERRDLIVSRVDRAKILRLCDEKLPKALARVAKIVVLQPSISREEIAERVGGSVAVVKVNLTRAYQTLWKLIDD